MKILKNIFKIIAILLIIIGSIVALAATVRGISGNPTPQTIYDSLRSQGKPFELSSERSRYALVFSIVENHSLEFSKNIAQLALPDLGTIHGKFVSLFAPGVSFAAIPLYILGKAYSLAQVGSFVTSSIFALLNLVLIALIVKRLTGNIFAGLVGGITFLFGTVAWPYAGTLYEHHYSVFLILLSILLAIGKKNILNDFLVGMLFGISIFIEYPAGVMFLPVIIWLISKHIEIKEIAEKVRVSVSFSMIAILIGFTAAIIPSLWYNKTAYGNPLQLSGTLAGIRTIEQLNGTANDKKVVTSDKTALGFFKLERLPQGFDVLLTSKDRGVLIFSPVILLGFLGLWRLSREKNEIAYALWYFVLIVMIFFSMWGDPWGGYAFGPRYLIPAFAILGIGIGKAVSYYGRKLLFVVTFVALFIYSTLVSLLGSLTTMQIPPSSDPASNQLPRPTFLYNLNLLKQGVSNSFIYNTYFVGKISLQNFAIILFYLIFILTITCYLISLTYSNKQKI